MSHEKECAELEQFHEDGTVSEFIDWVDAHPDWFNPIYENYLIRRDTVGRAALAVMRRDVVQDQ